jgi:hypothetical protein
LFSFIDPAGPNSRVTVFPIQPGDRDMLFRSVLVSLTAILILFCACSDDDTPNDPGAGSYTISGTVQFKQQITVPSTAKLTAVWTVSSGSPDYAYVYGRGSVDFERNTFSITFDGPPPAQALNDYSPRGVANLGVGMIVLGDFASTEPHRLTEGELSAVYGAVSNIGVIYIDGDPATFHEGSDILWPADFNRGFNTGEGVETQKTWDIFVPAAATTFVLTITTNPKDIFFPNWT